MMQPAITLAVMATFIGGPAVAQLDSFGEPSSTDDLVSASILTDVEAVQAGVPFTAAVHLKMKEHWHINWINPGDAGLAPTISWTMPEGWTAGDIQWPYPSRFDITELSIFGYDGEVYLLSRITPPTELSGVESKITARIDWLACAEACVPGKSVVTVTLKHGDAPASPATRAMFEEAMSVLPAIDKRLRFTASVVERHISIDVFVPMGDDRPPSNVLFFPFEPGLIENAAEQVFTKESGSYRLVVERSATNEESPTRVRGVLVSDTGWGGKRKAVAIDVPVR